MPQLDPAPWFVILIFTWAVFTTLLPPKVLSHKFPYEPSAKDAKTLRTTPWAWQWQ